MKRIYFSIFLVAAFLAYFLISIPIYSGDVKNHVAWGKSLLEQGSFGFFDRKFPGYSFPTYPPLIMYSFAASFGLYQFKLWLTYFLNNNLPLFPSQLVPWMEWENVMISFLKLPGLLATVVFAGVLPWFLRKSGEKLSIRNSYLIAGLILLNPAVIYISSIWGQTDLVQNLFLVLAIGFLLGKKFWISFIFAGIALMTKHTILLLWGVYIFYLFKEFGIKKTLQAIGVSLGIFYLSYLPFHSFDLRWPLQFYYSNFTLVDFGVAENAINFWGAVVNFGMASSHQSFLGVSFDLWGYFLFAFPVLPMTYLFFVKKTTAYHFFCFLYLVSLFYFFFFTRMHERYMIPVVLWGTILVCLDRGKRGNLGNMMSLAGFTLIHFINVYRGLLMPYIPGIFELTNTVWCLYLLVVVYAFLLVYNYVVFLKELICLPRNSFHLKMSFL